MAREPGYCLHKPTGQAYVNLGGKVVYLGQHGTEESKRKYNQLKAEWLVNRHSPKYSPQPTGPTVADVCLAFLNHATEYYQQGTEAEQYRWAMKPISELYATLPANRFGVHEVRTVRDWWLKTPIDRSKVRKPAKTYRQNETAKA